MSITLDRHGPDVELFSQRDLNQIRVEAHRSREGVHCRAVFFGRKVDLGHGDDAGCRQALRARILTRTVKSATQVFDNPR